MAQVEVGLEELERRLAPVGVTRLGRLTGGASSLTYAGQVHGDADRRVVVKVAPAGLPPVRNRDVLRQARVLRALHATPVPVPEVVFEDAGEPPDVPPLFDMTHVDGTSFEPLFDRDGDDDEATVADRMRDAVRVLASLHALEPGTLELGDEQIVTLVDEIDRWSRVLETVDPGLAPGWEPIASALRASAPRAETSAIVHGDFRLGNLLADRERISAVIDWEIWSLGDPRVDIGWFLVNADPSTYGRRTRYARAVPSLVELVDLYGTALGRQRTDLEWFQALACFKSVSTWALIVKHNRRRAVPDPALEEVAEALPGLLARAEHHL
jgi:aminoglycoside phosphotransferase (APT) family kinase protein